MILLLLVVVLLVAGAGAAGVLGGGLLGDGREGERSGAGWLSVPVVVAGGVVLLAVLALGVSGTRSGTEPAPAPASTLAGPSRTATTLPLPVARLAQAAADIPVVRIEPASGERFAPYQPVSGLAPGAVVRVVAEGFDWHERGRVQQCVTELGHQTACAEAFPVQFDDRGRADFQVAVRGDFAPGGCRAGMATCLLALTGESSGRRGSVQTVLVDSVTPGQVRVEPSERIVDGQVVAVSVSGFPPGTTATAVLCAPSAAYDARRCTSPVPTSAMIVDAAGRGQTTLVVGAGRIGADEVVCGPRRPCGVAVVVGPGFVVAPVAPVAFSHGPGPAYRAGRLAAGFGGALVLLGAAVAIARRSDWTKPPEAATPALDGADLRADQSLDELFGTDAEIDRRDPIRW